LSKRAFPWIIVGLLLIYLTARLTSLTAFPPFVDEAFHINFGRIVLASGPFARSEEGRQFVVWLYILFGAQANAPIWIARAANLIVLLPGLAAVMGTAKLLSNRWGAVFAALLIIFSPYHHFFERLALADPVASSAVLCALYFACRLKFRVAYRDAAFCGIALFLACGAKISALPYFAIPVIALIVFARSRAGLRWTVVALLVGIGLTGIYLGLLFWRGYNPFFYLETGRTTPLTQIILDNIGKSFATVMGYFTIPAGILLLIALAVLIVRRRFFLPLCLLLPLAVLWLSPRQDSRHLITPLTILLLTGAVVLGDLVQQRQSFRLPALALVTIGGLAIWLPFALTVAHAPAALVIPADDHAEYMTTEGSGFGLAEVIAALEPLHPTRVIGVLANCLGLHDIAPFPVDCPRLDPAGADIQALTSLLASSRAEGVYAVLETIPYAPTSAPGSVVATIDGEHPRLIIYNLAP